MNVYEKLLQARLKFHSTKIKKTGFNDYGKYWYFKLEDFIVPLLAIFDELRLLSVVTFTSEVAMMKIIDIDKPEDFIVFTSPMAGAALKATHEIQQVGAVETYQRRYLYVMAIDIAEHEAIDSSEGPATSMDDAETIEELQSIFATEYRAAPKEKKAAVKAEYDRRKTELVNATTEMETR